MLSLFLSFELLYNISQIILMISLFGGIITYVYSIKITPKSSKFKLLFSSTIFCLSLGIIATVSIWITGNIISKNSDNKIIDLKKSLSANDSLKQQLQLRVTQSNERSESALAMAVEARAKQTIAEFELERLKSSMKETSEKTEIVSRKIEQSQKLINTRVIDPIRMAEILNKRKDIKIYLYSINDPEAQHLFSDLNKAFNLANWQIIGSSAYSARTTITKTGIVIPQGIVIEASNNELANVLKSAFELFKISCSIETNNQLPENLLDVFIGAR